MNKVKRFSLSAQINIIFTIITVVTSVLFILIFKQTVKSITSGQANSHYKQYYESILSRYENGEEPLTDKYYSYIIYNITKDETVYSYYLENINLDLIKEFINLDKINSNKITIVNDLIKKYENNYFIINKFNYNEDEHYLVVVNDSSYEIQLKEPVGGIIFIGFIAIIILGNAIILLWSSVTVERIKELEFEVANLTNKSYRTPIKVDGNDEITELASAIDRMREEILKNDEVKQEMLQNLSHDIKTPIAVIKSYSEAIKDGITEIEDIDIIIKQTELLTEKIKKLLEWNRIEYIDDKADFYPVDMNRVITTIANNFKFKKDIQFELNLDNSSYMGLEDHYFTLISNIVENALRYAKTIIKITMKDKKITIYNDGEPIPEKFINMGFRPYEKGHKGEFGLGLTIVQKIVANFNLKLTIRNINNGVEFKIEPL